MTVDRGPAEFHFCHHDLDPRLCTKCRIEFQLETPRQVPEWVRRARANRLTPKDMTHEF